MIEMLNFGEVGWGEASMDLGIYCTVERYETV
jgi:hypothetical protein